MKVTYLESAAILIEDGSDSILCDPWLVDGAYFGSWCHYPPPPFEPADFSDIDFIYISHVHPDHCCDRTFSELDDDIPIIIHDYRWDYLRDRLESKGFEVIELSHDERFHLVGDLHINVLAADGCDPSLCGNFFGCDWFDDENDGTGTTQVDTMAVIDDGEYVVVDTNDCPYPLAQYPCRRIVDRYGEVDLLCHQYSAAQFYPQSMVEYSHERKLREAHRVIREKYEYAMQFIDLLDPDFYMPFAGEYVLAGRLADLNPYTANPPRAEAKAYFSSSIDEERSRCIFLNSGEHLDLRTGTVSKPFEPINPRQLERYIDQVLRRRQFDYEYESRPTVEELEALLPAAYERLEDRRRTVGFETDTRVLISFPDDGYLSLSMKGDGYRLVGDPDLNQLVENGGYVRFEIDSRLLEWLLEGPSKAHWADAKIGSHLGIDKRPDIYERGLYNTMGSFYAGQRERSVVSPSGTRST